MDLQTHKTLEALPAIFIMVGGPSGVGKTAILDALISQHPRSYQRPRSFTTRQRRTEESEQEYSFVTRQALAELFAQGRVLRLDEAYGNQYAISRESIDQFQRLGICPVKEIHPSNQRLVAACVPMEVMSVLVLPLRSAERGTIQRDLDRQQQDDVFFGTLDSSSYDLVFRVDTSIPLSAIAASLHVAIQTERLARKLPIPDSGQARKGYDTIAPEFKDSLRITTANFHDLSSPFLQKALDSLPPTAASCLEVGAGGGWARSALKWPILQYIAFDISHRMLLDQNSERRVVGDCDKLPFRTSAFDVVLASLADPFCHPRALAEIRRVLTRGGWLILTCPANEWARLLRRSEEESVTTFLMSDGSPVTVPSITYSLEALCNLLTFCGFNVLESQRATSSELPSSHTVSSAISSVLRTNMRLPLVNLAIATPGLKLEVL